MNRLDFIKCCALGACSTFVPLSQFAAADEGGAAKALQYKLDAARVRYAKLVGILTSELDHASTQRIFNRLGRECAAQFRTLTFDKYAGDINGFLAAIQQPSGWVEKADYDEKRGTIRIVDRHTKCSCPLVQEGLTSAYQCQCTLGWQQETYSRILGKPVVAEIEQSILQGANRCVFLIHIQDVKS